MKRMILVTGGMDSTVLVYKSLAEGIKPILATVDYGQEVIDKQVKLINKMTNRLGLDKVLRININMGFIGGLGDANFKLEGDSDTNKDFFTDQKMKFNEFFIEGRNLIMMSHCMALASTKEVDEIQVGYLYNKDKWDNRRCFKLVSGDNSPHFVDLLNVIALTGFTHNIRVRAPYFEDRMDKEDVVMLGKKLGVNFKHTHSCYWTKPCGKCDNCVARDKYL